MASDDTDSAVSLVLADLRSMGCELSPDSVKRLRRVLAEDPERRERARQSMANGGRKGFRARRSAQQGLRRMTNREMVKDPRGGGPKLPEPNVPQRVLVPAPEGDPNLFTMDDPIDSPHRALGGCSCDWSERTILATL